MQCEVIVEVVKIMIMIDKNFSTLCRLKSFEERFEYLRLDSVIGIETFGHSRYINQSFYTSQIWRHTRNQVILRDSGCDLGIEDYTIYDRIIIHHMNQITEDDIIMQSEWLLNPEYLICTSLDTHNAIHYGDYTLLPQLPVERTRNDTCPWRR